MIARVRSVALVGMEARPVEVEVDLGQGVPDFQIVGLPSRAVKEARQRVRSAIAHSEEVYPQRRVTINLAPGDLRKEGALLDLAMALGVLIAAGHIKPVRIEEYLFLGELALDGRLRPVRGVLAAAIAARESGARGVVVPHSNAAEAALAGGVEVVAAGHLAEAVAFVTGDLTPEAPTISPEQILRAGLDGGPDLSEVRGQAFARRALEIAAAGAHNLLMVGPPGSGKTMLARRLPGILPPLTLDEALEVTKVWSVAGLLRPGQALVATRPFRAPHHHASPAAIIGGGSPLPRPGEVSLAHCGVLFFDEVPLFSRAVLDGLRQPLEDGEVTVARMGSAVCFPCRVAMVAAANPCPCGRLGERGEPCSCPPGRLESYRSRLSGPLLDRFDLFAEVPRLSDSELLEMRPGECSAAVRARVIEARGRRDARGADPTPADLPPPAREFLRGALARRLESARAVQKVARVAGTIADLEGAEEIGQEHLAEAFQYRRAAWG